MGFRFGHGPGPGRFGDGYSPFLWAWPGDATGGCRRYFGPGPGRARVGLAFRWAWPGTGLRGCRAPIAPGQDATSLGSETRMILARGGRYMVSACPVAPGQDAGHLVPGIALVLARGGTCMVSAVVMAPGQEAGGLSDRILVIGGPVAQAGSGCSGRAGRSWVPRPYWPARKISRSARQLTLASVMMSAAVSWRSASSASARILSRM